MGADLALDSAACPSHRRFALPAHPKAAFLPLSTRCPQLIHRVVHNYECDSHSVIAGLGASEALRCS